MSQPKEKPKASMSGFYFPSIPVTSFQLGWEGSGLLAWCWGPAFTGCCCTSLFDRWRALRAATPLAPSTACAPTTHLLPTWDRGLALPHALPRSWPLRTSPPTQSQKREVSAPTGVSGTALPWDRHPWGLGCCWEWRLTSESRGLQDGGCFLEVLMAM